MSRRPAPPRFNCADQARATWIERADRAVDLVEAALPGLQPPVRLADLGCGDQKLRARLERRELPVEYRGFDLVPQAAEVLRYDITSDPPPEECDIFVLLGVVEYLKDVPAALARLAPACRRLIVSHVVSNRTRYAKEDLERLGWITHMTEDAFAALLRAAGFAIERALVTEEGRIVVWLCSPVAAP